MSLRSRLITMTNSVTNQTWKLWLTSGCLTPLNHLSCISHGAQPLFPPPTHLILTYGCLHVSSLVFWRHALQLLCPGWVQRLYFEHVVGHVTHVHMCSGQVLLNTTCLFLHLPFWSLPPNLSPSLSDSLITFSHILITITASSLAQWHMLSSSSLLCSVSTSTAWSCFGLDIIARWHPSAPCKVPRLAIHARQMCDWIVRTVCE